MKNKKISLKAARGLCEITQSEMANKLGVTRKTYFNYENYKTTMPVTKAMMFSDITGVPLTNIIFF